MKRLAAILTALPLFGAITLSSSKALADSYASGTPSNVATFNRSSDIYPSYRGWLYIGTQYYLWGGSYCSAHSYTPSETDLYLLSNAVTSRRLVGVYYKQGTYSYPCLTGYVIYPNTSTSTNAVSEQAPGPK